MSNHQIKIIAALCALALCATSSTTAQTTSTTSSQGQQPTPSTSSSTTDRSTSTTGASVPQPSASDEPTRSQAAAGAASSTRTEPSSTSSSPSSQNVSESAAQAPGASIPSASTNYTSPGASSKELKRADSTAEESSAAKLKGQRVKDSGANELGKINDFIIDGASGKISHVVISTGGILGVGDKLRLIPGASLKRSGTDFTSDMAKAEFEALPTISEQDLEAGRIMAQSSVSSQPSSASASLPTGQVVTASQLKDRSIRSDDHQVGEIEHVIVDLEKGEAMALIDVNSAFAGESGEFLVPFSKLEVRSAQEEHINSSLLKSDFASLQSSDTTAAAGTSSSTASTAQSTVSEAGAGSVTSQSQIGRETPATTASTSTTGSSTASESAAATTDRQSDPTQAGRTAAISGISAQDTTSRNAATDSSLSTSQSGSSTGASPSPSASSQSSTDSTRDFASETQKSDPTRSRSDPASSSSTDRTSSSSSAVASTPGTTTTDAAVTGDTTRSPGLADTANAPRDPASTSPTVVTNTPSPVPGDEQLTPTGRSSAEQSPASGATAMAIRQALDSDATLAREDVQVTTKIVLQGSVKSEEAKNRIEELAKKAANDAEIDNQIKVQQN